VALAAGKVGLRHPELAGLEVTGLHVHVGVFAGTALRVVLAYVPFG
jgi:hypothetical protein